MCELFCMSSRRPATIQLSLEAFARHGGLAGPHKDGWGLAWYVDEDVRLLKEPHPASASACVRFVQEHPFEATLVVSHIRKATRGGVAMKNCQPFVRELGGHMHVFAHNGDLAPLALREGLALDSFAPVGETDSEYAFCGLLENLRRLWRRNVLPSLQDRLDAVGTFAALLRPLGPANFVYSDGDALFIHGDRRTQADRGIRPPGLHLLQWHCAHPARGFATEGLVLGAVPDQAVVLAASVPLTDEPGWRPLASGEIVVARAGEIVAVAGAPAPNPS